MNHLFKALLAAAVAFVLAPAALAASVSVGSSGGAGASVGHVSASTSISGSLKAGGLDTASSTGHANLGAAASSSNASATGTLMRGEHAAATGLRTITAADAAQGTTLDSSSAVSSEDDFNAFARGQIRGNGAITAVDSGSDHLTVYYAEHGRLLGIFPMVMSSSASIDTSGKVTLAHPWYYFLAASDSDNSSLAAAISTEAAATFNRQPSQAAVGATSTVAARTSLTPSERAQLLADINLALKTVIGASAASSTAAVGP